MGKTGTHSSNEVVVVPVHGHGETIWQVIFELHSAGKDSEKRQLPYSGSSRTLATGGDGHAVTTGAYAPITMNGRDVYKFATREVPTVITEALANAGVTIDEVDWLLLHQANIRIMESVADKLGVSFDKVLHNLSEYGNTSAGSIPLALEEAVSSGKVKKGDVIVCAGFGAGLSWGAAVLRWGEGLLNQKGHIGCDALPCEIH